ncbi:MAG: hypothetical protein IRZ16_14285 [Myxococcaceae bacterium]|nr:hypothetical protein [Myxococcaceae bacterium]
MNLNHKLLHDYADSLKTKTLAQLEAERAKVAAEYAHATDGVVRGSRVLIATDKVKLAILGCGKREEGRNDAGDAGDAGGPDAQPGQRGVRRSGDDGGERELLPGIGLRGAAQGGGRDVRGAADPQQWALRRRHRRAAGRMGGAVEGGGVQGRLLGVSDGGSAEQVAADARLAAQLTAQYKGDFYVADCEGAFQAGQGDPALNKVFVDNFQAAANELGIGNIPRAVEHGPRGARHAAVDRQRLGRDAAGVLK